MNLKLLYIFGGVLVAILLRCITSLHSYSGEHKAPMFGDYEAQRHWMEITYNLPIKQWYFNSSENDLMYWGLDYPPLTAYHSFICGYFANLINPSFVELNKSRGYESGDHKLFMRYTVLTADILIYIPALCLYFYLIYKSEVKVEIENAKRRKPSLKKPNKTQLEEYPVEKGKALRRRKVGNETVEKQSKNVTFSNKVYVNENKNTKYSNTIQSFLLALLYPGIILIDHGHFQYNCISLGLTILAVNCLLINRNILASILFTLAINYKQMELYHSLPFFFYFLHLFLVDSKTSVFQRFIQVFKIGLVVLLTFIVVWSPFIFELKSILQVLHRLFPLARGVFEDKVANFWCTVNLLIKFKNIFDNFQMAKICLIATLFSVLPSCLDLLIRGNKNKFILSLINCSLGFFLFSFQVHEKSILIVAIPVILYFHRDPFFSFWFLYISCFSMVPLLIRDGLLLPYLALANFYLVSYRLMTKRQNSHHLQNPKFGKNPYIRELLITLLNVNDGDKDYTDIVTLSFKHLFRNWKLVRLFLIKTTFMLSYTFSLFLVFLLVVFEPPDEFPDLFPLLVSVYSFLHFIIFFIYFNYSQFVCNDKSIIVNKQKKQL